MGNGTVLLVDDEPVVLQMHSSAVRHFGFEVLIAESAEEGIALTRKYSPALVISDVQMPGEGGFDFIASLVEQDLKNMPAIYLTGYDDIDIVRGGLKAGGDDFIIKGTSIEVLRQRIAFWMVSGFKSLPVDIRRRAIAAANAVSGDSFPGVMHHFRMESDIVSRISRRVQAELSTLPDTFGCRLIERVCFMARVTKVALEESADFAEYVKFPEILFRAVQSLDITWASGMASLYANFDDWASDDRFGEAGLVPLEKTMDYTWYETVA
ncbi:response regulator [Kordiimonas pumila]|uniref:Response regulator n=1 Tax=Kordiimonas pumila TaxID=2161677 RepID=A0ABV7D109_9PROT|nr:response regulator [Kordiimonas pumila]